MDTVPIYKDPAQPVEKRVEDLLSRMTLEEKVGQMLQLNAHDKEREQNLREKRPGSYLKAVGKTTAEARDLAKEHGLEIPILFADDAIHGFSFLQEAVIFPTQLGLASSWNCELMERVARITAVEMSYTGVHWTFSPVLCLTRDLRWGRVNETFGEDPYLIGVFAAAMIRGYQGEDLSDPRSVLACAKHYAGYSETQGGRDASEADLSRRKLLSYFLPPFEEASRAGCATFMTGYQAIDGVPCTANRWLLTEVLRDDWGFEGFVITDWDNVGHMVYDQRVCETYEEASVQATEAGNDMIMATPQFFDATVDAVRSGRLKEALVDEACRRILRIKFRMGLFENQRYPDAEEGAKVIGCSEHRELARQCARECTVLLKNEGGLLPLDEAAVRRIAVIGPNADDPKQQLGDWSLGAQYAGESGYPRENTVTVLDGIRSRVGEGCEVMYARGCDIVEPGAGDIAAAASAAEAADVAIVVVGDCMTHVGESRSTATLELTGSQQDLLEAVRATGTPMVVVLVHSKPLAMPWIAEHADAVLEAWNPGMEGGTGVAEILFGDVNPCGRLTISFPRHAGQQPIFYNQVPGQHGDRYADLSQDPLYAFGFGLSYTTWRYENLRLAEAEIGPGQGVRAEVDLTNTGSREGVEIVQLYVRDLYTSATWPVKQLKAFQRVTLDPGETRTVVLEIPHEALSLVNAACQRVVEPGDFEILVGPSSRDDDLQKASLTVTT
jgi:beta-glucosidase